MIFMKSKTTVGCIILEPGNSKVTKTGSWRTFRPVVDAAKCTGCTICATFCPDGCIDIVEKKAIVNYDYCKGCMICKTECPFGAINEEKEKK